MDNRTNLTTLWVISVFLVVLAVSATAAGGTIYVDADAIGANNGSSWTDAYRYLQNGLAAAWSGDEIRVAQGIYKPDRGGGNAPGDRYATFQLINGVAIYGGYAGVGEPDPNARDIELYKTILSGDLLGNDGPDFANNSENSYHVVTGSGTDATAVLDGFTITGGNANGVNPNDRGGGGMYNDSGSPTVTNCTFSGNSADHWGGGVYCNTSSPIISDCIITGNYGANGGGIYGWEGSPTISNCIINGNRAYVSGGVGGGIYFYKSSGRIINCQINENSSGAIGLDRSSPEIINCTIAYNAEGMRSAIRCRTYSSPHIINCILNGNTNDAVWCFNRSSPTITNCTIVDNRGHAVYTKEGYGGTVNIASSILWGNSAGQIRGSAVVTYSDIAGGWPGEGNIDIDPCFVEPGYWDANGVWGDGDYHLLPDSPCINTGDPNYIVDPNQTDLDGKPRVIGGRIDMGAYEFQPPHILYVDDDAPNDPGPGDPGVSDPEENGTEQHPFDTIQEAMDVAGDGDTVIVLPGDYYENTDFMGKNFTLTSADPEDPTIRQATRIHAESGYAIIASDGNIFGLSISGNNGIRCFDIDYTSYSPTIRNCRIIVERIGIRFTLPYCHEAVHPVIENNIIAGNHHCIYMDAQAFASGGVEGVIRNNVFTSSGGDKIGCGITYRGCKSVPEVVNNIFVNLQYGIHIFYCCKFQERTARINYNNLYDNHQNYRVEAGSCPLDLTGVQGNISEDPLFVDFANGDFHLGPNSPCINAGDPDYVAGPNETDLDGKPRVIGGRIDMGAYEFNHIPVACIVDGNQVVEAEAPWGARVTLDGSGSSDEDSTPGTNDDIVHFDWYKVDACDPNFEDFLASGEIIDCNLPLGEHIIVLEVIDKAEAFDTNEVTIIVQDTTPPEFALSVTPTTLWSANHKMVLITPSWTVSDICDDSPAVSLVSITMNEADEATGDGHTTLNIQIGDDGSIYLRAERSGTGSGRIYTITYQAVDDSGNVAVASATVTVPHDQR